MFDTFRYGVFFSNIFEAYQLVFNQTAQRIQFFGSNDTQLVAGPGIFAQVKECNDDVQSDVLLRFGNCRSSDGSMVHHSNILKSDRSEIFTLEWLKSVYQRVIKPGKKEHPFWYVEMVGKCWNKTIGTYFLGWWYLIYLNMDLIWTFCRSIYLVGGLEHVLCFHRLGMSIHPNCYSHSIIFQRGRAKKPPTR